MHIIRLRHPWQAAWRDLSTDAPLAPIHSRSTQQLRTAHYSRKFHRPSGLRKQQPVTLILQSTAAASLVLQPIKNQPLPTPTTTHLKSAATDATPSCTTAACTVAIHSILLNLHPLPLSTATSDGQLIPLLSVRIESILESFNVLEIVCGMAAGDFFNDETAAVQSADACAASPLALSQWAEVRLEIDD